MENNKPKRNFIPLIIFLLIIGLGAAALSKPTDSTNDSAKKDGTMTSLLPKVNPVKNLIEGNTADTFCENNWQDKGTPNVPNFGADEHFCGNPNAKIIIVQYTDFECPFCKQFHPTLTKLVSESNGQIGWVLRHYPIDQLHSRARNEALATECAYEQAGEIGFWRFANKIFSVTSANNSLPPEMLPLIASDMGLDKDAFASCMSSGKYLAKISAQEQLAEDKGPVGTPNSRIILNGREVEEVKGAVDYASLKAKTDLWLKAE